MAAVDVLPGEQLLIQVETETPGTFAHPCLINTERGFSRSASTVTENVPDCADPSLPAWQSTEVDGLSANISGGGMLDVATLEFWDEWFESGLSKTVKVKVNKTGGRTYTGKYKLTTWDITGTRKNKATGAVALTSDGPVTSAVNAA